MVARQLHAAVHLLPGAAGECLRAIDGLHESTIVSKDKNDHRLRSIAQQTTGKNGRRLCVASRHGVLAQFRDLGRIHHRYVYVFVGHGRVRCQEWVFAIYSQIGNDENIAPAPTRLCGNSK